MSVTALHLYIHYDVQLNHNYACEISNMSGGFGKIKENGEGTKR